MSKSFTILRSGTAIGAALLLAACHPSADSGADGNVLALPALPATLPLAAGEATTPAYAPTADALPAAPRLRTVRVADPRDSYAYADDAWDFGDAVFDAPPDYGFDYAGIEPWAWQGYDQSLTFVEPIDDGYRYYYYRPGADEPYFIRDPYYGYGYDGDQLAVIYGPDGAILPYDDYGPRLDYASRYLVRARNLYAASRERDRRAVNAANWAARAAAISAAQARWSAERARQDAWRDYHQRTAATADRHWQEERQRRQADAQRFAAWRQNDFHAAPPPRVIPAAWQQARWARDDRRYVALPARQPAAAARAAAQHRVAQDQAARQQADRPRDLALQQREAAVQTDAAQRRQQLALAQQQARAQHDQQRAADMARAQADRAARQAGEQQRAAQHQLGQAQAREAQRGQMQTRQGQHVQADAARAQAQAQAVAREQARAAQTAARDQGRVRAQAADQARMEAQRARGQAEAQARAQAQAARAQAQQQARGQAEAQARAQAQAARAQMQAQAQAAHAQAQAARMQAQAVRAQPQPQRPAPQAPQPAHGGGGGNPGHGEHGHHPG